jgi:hypothetical protein
LFVCFIVYRSDDGGLDICPSTNKSSRLVFFKQDSATSGEQDNLLNHHTDVDEEVVLFKWEQSDMRPRHAHSLHLILYCGHHTDHQPLHSHHNFHHCINRSNTVGRSRQNQGRDSSGQREIRRLQKSKMRNADVTRLCHNCHRLEFELVKHARYNGCYLQAFYPRNTQLQYHHHGIVDGCNCIQGWRVTAA